MARTSAPGVQAFNDFLVFGAIAVASFSSDKLLASFGWSAVKQVVFPVLLVAGTCSPGLSCAAAGQRRRRGGRFTRGAA